MLKKISVVIGLLASVPVYADSIETLQHQLRARDAAILDMQNRIDVNERTIRSLQGEMDDLKMKVNSLEKILADSIAQEKIRAEATASAAKASQATNTNNESRTDTVTISKDKQPSVKEQDPVSKGSQKKSSSSAAISSEEQRKYDLAFAKVSSNDFSGAKTAFNSFIEEYSDSKLVPNCYYWMGQMALKQSRYDEAKQNFLKVTQYPDSSKRADSIFKLGQVAQKSKDNEKAKKFYQLVIKSYPNTTEAVMASRALESLK